MLNCLACAVQLSVVGKLAEQATEIFQSIA